MGHDLIQIQIQIMSLIKFKIFNFDFVSGGTIVPGPLPFKPAAQPMVGRQPAFTQAGAPNHLVGYQQPFIQPPQGTSPKFSDLLPTSTNLLPVSMNPTNRVRKSAPDTGSEGSGAAVYVSAVSSMASPNSMGALRPPPYPASYVPQRKALSQERSIPHPHRSRRKNELDFSEKSKTS
jgi:hypothetical protein